MERSKLVCTPVDITILKEKIPKMDIVDLCTRERANTKWKFYKLTNLTFFAALLKVVPIDCKDSVLPEPLLENQNVNCLTFKKIHESLTMTIFAFSEQLLCIYLATRERRRKHLKCSTFSWTIVGKEIHQIPGCSHHWYSEGRGDVATQYFSLQHWLCGWRADWGTSTTKYSKVWKERQTSTLQQSYLLRQRHELRLQIVLLQHMWHNLFKNWKFRATFDNMQWASQAHLPKNVYQLGEKLFEKLDSFIIPYREDQNLSKILAHFDFEFICIEEET